MNFLLNLQLIILFMLTVPCNAKQPANKLVKYGQLILVGNPDKKMDFNRRDEPNGIQQNAKSIRTAAEWPYSRPNCDDEDSTATHTMTFSFSDIEKAIAEYCPDPNRDMFQIGRSRSEKIDLFVESMGCSRFACRIVADRNAPENVYIYAAGFDEDNDIFLGEDAKKMKSPNGQFDGLVTNGVFILSPNSPSEEEDALSRYSSASSSSLNQLSMANEEVSRGEISPTSWKEVSVIGDIYSKRKVRAPGQIGEFEPGLSNKLEDGTLIDICGATLLWRSAEGLTKSPTAKLMKEQLDQLNMEQRPQCPVQMHTLIFSPGGEPTTETSAAGSSSESSRTPYVYKKCGHVQSRHGWESLHHVAYKCPVCNQHSDAIIKLSLGDEPAFHVDTNEFDHSFIPCGHIASESTVKHWSNIPIPKDESDFHKICPFCNTALDNDRPFVKLYFC